MRGMHLQIEAWYVWTRTTQPEHWCVFECWDLKTTVRFIIRVLEITEKRKVRCVLRTHACVVAFEVGILTYGLYLRCLLSTSMR